MQTSLRDKHLCHAQESANRSSIDGLTSLARQSCMDHAQFSDPTARDSPPQPQSPISRSAPADAHAHARSSAVGLPPHHASGATDMRNADLQAADSAVSYTHLRAHETVLDLV